MARGSDLPSTMPSTHDLVALCTVMDHIGRVYKFTPERYPQMRYLPAEDHKNFAVKHSVLHAVKTAGRLAAQCESVDHGASPNYEALREGATKLFITAVKLAQELEMGPADLYEGVLLYAKGE